MFFKLKKQKKNLHLWFFETVYNPVSHKKISFELI